MGGRFYRFPFIYPASILALVVVLPTSGIKGDTGSINALESNLSARTHCQLGAEGRPTFAQALPDPPRNRPASGAAAWTGAARPRFMSPRRSRSAARRNAREAATECFRCPHSYGAAGAGPRVETALDVEELGARVGDVERPFRGARLDRWQERGKHGANCLRVSRGQPLNRITRVSE